MLKTLFSRIIQHRQISEYSPRLLCYRRLSNCKSMASQSTAGIIIIGDELIKGKVLDTNSHFLAKKLYELGVEVRRIEVLPDNSDEIASEVAAFSKRYTHVVTAGGIGPTHDDITYQAIAKGLDEKLTLHPQLVHLIQSHFKITVPDYDPLNPAEYPADVDTSAFHPAVKMALVPKSSRLHFSDWASAFPMVQVRNVYIMPGIPKYLHRCAKHLDELVRNDGRTYHSSAVYTLMDEVSLAPILNEAVKRHGSYVSFGSYPVMGNNYYNTRVTMESTDAERVSEAHEFLSRQLPEDKVVAYEPDAVQRAPDVVSDIVEGRGDEQLRGPVTHAYQVIEQCLSRYRPEEVCVSFNGGKDCSALLHLVHAAWTRRATGCRLRALYIRGADPFVEMEQFIEETRRRYDLELWTVPGPVRPGLTAALDQLPEIKAVLMGTRRSDPHAANLQAFQMTDAGWPSVMRVSPILDWSYQQVWRLLRKLSLPYCTLYDHGYTSVGNRGNTQPNPALRIVDPETGAERYRPAYFLSDCMTERQGRL